jgi:uncharacterized protein YbbC (DUF1343 family)
MFNKTIILFTLHSLPFTIPAFSQVSAGADRLFSDEFHLVAGKRVGLVTNHTAVLSNGRHLADSLFAHPEVTLTALFGPEHGIRGEAPAGGHVGDGRDSATGVTVFSLYGRTYKPTPEMLRGIDVLLFDIQDVGARFYTYISTMSYAMEAAAENGIPFIVLDRPNPITGVRVEGPIREDSLKSFVGLHPIPIVHGMTVGELATMFNEEGWLKGGVKADLHVVKMEGWKRETWYDETGLRWIPPSPNIRTLETAIVYPGTCLIEGTNLSEGRGTDRPFEYIGAPYVDGEVLAMELNKLNLPGVDFQAISFTPRATIGATNPKYSGIPCSGVVVRVTKREAFEPVRTGHSILVVARRLFGDQFALRAGALERLVGAVPGKAFWGPDSDDLWGKQAEEFLRFRSGYLLY